MSALSLGLFNTSKDEIARRFAYVYAVISICVLVSEVSFPIFTSAKLVDCFYRRLINYQLQLNK